MNYFVSCLYGDVDKYRQIVADLELKNDDRLWILGDVLDGNDEHPEVNLSMLDEIMRNPNVKMVLGDHEYFQNMRYVSYSDQDNYNAWVTYINNMDISGKAFNDFIENEMSKEDQDSYFGSYLLSLELSEVVRIGDRYFYLVHGSPIPYRDDVLTQWQIEVCTKVPNLTVDYWKTISYDPAVYPFLRNEKPMSQKNTIVISGQYPPFEAASSIQMPIGDAGIFYHNKILCIGRRTVDEPVPVVGIDAAGFFVKGIY